MPPARDESLQAAQTWRGRHPERRAAPGSDSTLLPQEVHRLQKKPSIVSSRLLHIRKKAQNLVDDLRCSLNLESVGARQGLIRTHFMLGNRGQVPFIAVGQREGKRFGKWSHLLDLEADLYEDLGWDGSNPQITDPECLKRYGPGFWCARELQNPVGVERLIPVPDVGVLRFFQYLMCIGQHLVGSISPSQRDLLITGVELHPVLILHILISVIDFCGDHIGDLMHLLIGGPRLPSHRKVDIVDIATGPVGEDADKRCIALISSNQMLNPLCKYSEVVR